MNLSKSYDFFQPEKISCPIHIIGCGSVGSTVAENLARCGVFNLVLWDFDKVEPHNLCNQMFRLKDVGRLKVDALSEILAEIDPESAKKISVHPEGWKGERLTGIVVLAVDNIDLRREICKKHIRNPYVNAVFDVRTGLTDAQHYAADWASTAEKNNLLASMDFTHEEAAESTPVSACGVTLGVATTVRLISALCVNNIIRWAKGEGIWKFVQIDGFGGLLDCF